MIADSTACLFFSCNPCARAELHQQERAQKLCSATLNYSRLLNKSHFCSSVDIYFYLLWFCIIMLSDWLKTSSHFVIYQKPSHNVLACTRFSALHAVHMYWLRAVIGSLDCLCNCDWPELEVVTLGFAYNTLLKTVQFHEIIAINYTIVFTTFVNRQVISAIIIYMKKLLYSILIG